MRAARRLVPATLVVLLGLLVTVATGAEWGSIAPGASTMDAVRTRYGGPTRTSAQKIDGHDSVKWVYEGARAPTGITRMTVDFGLLGRSGYHREIVRTLTLEPRRGVFTREIVVNGWGVPARMGQQNGADTFFYREGLLVYFDREGTTAQVMVFTPPQPSEPEPAAPKR